MWAENIIYILTATTIAALCIVVIANKWTRIRRIYFALLLLTLIYILAQFITIVISSRYALNVLRTGALGVNFLSYVAVLFCLDFTGHSLTLRQGLWLALPVCMFAVFGYSPMLVQSVTVESGGFSTTTGVLYGAQTVVVVAYFLAAIGVLVAGVKKARGSVRSNTQLLILGFSLPVAVNFITNVILVNNSSAQVLVPISLLFLSGSTGYAIIRHQLFDIRLFVLRAAAYLTTLFVMTVLLVIPMILLFGHFLQFHPSRTEFLLVVVLSTGALYILQSLRKLFDKTTAKIFFRHDYDPQEVLDRLSDILVRTVDIEVLRNETTALLQEALKPSSLRYALFADGSKEGAKLAETVAAHSSEASPNLISVDDPDEQNHRPAAVLKEEGYALAVKLRTAHESMGYIVLGYKRSGEAYSNRDIRLLSVAADEIAISLQNALRFEEIQNFNDTLQERIHDATGKLRRTNARLKQLNETKDDFVSMASHQLRTPLTSVEGYLSMVLEGDAGELNEQQRKLLEQSYNSSRQMVYLISDLLNISRISTGKFVIEPSAVDLDQIVQDEIGQLNEIARNRNITLTYAKPVNFPKLMLDETKTHQVVMNLMDNAVHYTQPGGSVTVTLRETPTAVEYTVKDTGIGVPKAARFHLFTKFYRAPNAQKTRPDGTGLGLFMAKKVVTAQGGAIIFHSEEGKGSTFGFRLPKAGHLVTET